ncbi:protein VASCULAR ASSOCIATED DEATH 1, chloroplastic-like isoform X4 [Gossypium australe]|uniref:Protein VASCULAR ASSOCIATED DEATH 1, chloroplastic-like isoform X4 n=1 Tax=Gossypium australe TaxID=47621 RepID=A0A5B6UXN0_9ROSI|nr:protein VASCULAR ASSOCIATED DEATH 1, chloroplastic-like isoform X4 [Gossypium australe]
MSSSAGNFLSCITGHCCAFYQEFWDVERDSDGPVEGCISRVYVNVAFNKKTVWKAPWYRENSEVYSGRMSRSLCNLAGHGIVFLLYFYDYIARELLKQNIDKQGGVDPSGSSTENGGHQIENKVATIEEPLERSQNLSDPVRTLQMSTFMDVNQRIANLLQGTLSNASSIASFLSKFLRKSFSYSKRQGHISLLLAVAFAVIFLMQASIVVLLKKPQQVLVRYLVTYMGSAGGGAGERQAEAVAWLEKRMHELKEQMAMVESLLERMRYEHAAMKAQLEQLG